MNDETKEIKLWKEKTKGIFHITEYTRFWNYITNLQQAVKDTKDSADDMLYELKQENERKERLITQYGEGMCAYANRIEKAIEYIEKQKKKMYKSRNKIAMFILMKLENILQNGSDSQ